MAFFLFATFSLELSQPPMQWVPGVFNLEGKVAVMWLTTCLLSIAEGYEGQKTKFHRGL
jgi:hypothetical protein